MRRKNKDMPKLLAAAATLTLLCGGLGYMAVDGWDEVGADQYGCYGASNKPTVAVIIDSSEPRWDKTQQRGIYTYFELLHNELGANQRLAVYTTQIHKVASILKPAFYVCGQAKSSDELPSNAVQAQAGYLKRQKQRLYDEVFKPELDKVLALDIPEKERQVYESPIFELLQTVSHMESLSQGDTLVMVSDGVQSTESARFCSVQGAMPSFNSFKKRRIYKDRLKLPRLEGLDVSFLFLQRGGYGEGALRYCSSEEEIRAFWKAAFKDVGANVDYIRVRSGAEQ
ncbi:MAG: hypothetical protein ACI9SP_000731 [Arenicella sp.]|jgi:hypothetical protein